MPTPASENEGEEAPPSPPAVATVGHGGQGPLRRKFKPMTTGTEVSSLLAKSTPCHGGPDGPAMHVKCMDTRPHKSAVWDSTLGFPGEGPGPDGQLLYGTQNMNGSLTGNAWRNLLREAKRRTLDILLVQEHNLPVDDPKRLEVMRETARAFGFSYCYVAGIPKNKGRGGTATLISDRVEASNIVSFDRSGGNMTVTNFECNNLKLRIVNVYAPQQEVDAVGNPLPTRRDNFYKMLKRHVTKTSIIIIRFFQITIII